MLAERWDDKQEIWGETQQRQARCNDGTGDLVALFYSDEIADIARAKALCGECPVRDDCLEAALARREPYGVWGGKLFHRGKVLAFKRPRGRPPKNPRPLLAEAEPA